MTCRGWGVGLLVAAGVLLPTAGAWGHASGQLPHARWSAEGRQVLVEWTAAPDDAADVGVAVGKLGEEAVLAYLGGPLEDEPSAAEIRALSRSEELRAYLLDNVQVAQDGRPCAAEVHPAEDFIADGARFVFTCPEHVEQADLRVTILHDRDELYATYSVDGSPQYAVHTVTQPEHPWDFTMAADDGPVVEPALLVGAAGVLAAIAVGVRFLGSPRDRRRGDA